MCWGPKPAQGWDPLQPPTSPPCRAELLQALVLLFASHHWTPPAPPHSTEPHIGCNSWMQLQKSGEKPEIPLTQTLIVAPEHTRVTAFISPLE